jgi:hypothetical protein
MYGSPMLAQDILVRLGEEPTRTAVNRLAAALNLWVRRKRLFTRLAPQTFGLIEWTKEISE